MEKTVNHCRQDAEQNPEYENQAYKKGKPAQQDDKWPCDAVRQCLRKHRAAKIRRKDLLRKRRRINPSGCCKLRNHIGQALESSMRLLGRRCRT